MASEEDPSVYGEDDLDDDDDDVDADEDDDVNVEDDSTSSAAGEVTVAVAVAGVPITRSSVPLPDPKRRRTEDLVVALMAEEKKPSAVDDSRKLFQRLWTDEDEIELLQGFLDYTTQRGINSSYGHHHDTTVFYDQIKGKLQLDFNKNQLVEKLRRLKKKYRNVLSKISSGKEYVFKSPHDQATFQIACKIWSSGSSGPITAIDGNGLDDEESNPNPNSNPFSSPNPKLNISLPSKDNSNNCINLNSSERIVARQRKHLRGVKIEEKFHTLNQEPMQSSTSIPDMVEETVKVCFQPLFKELLSNAINTGPCSFGGMNLNQMPFSFGLPFNLPGVNVADGKWRKQHILELEVYSKRLELMQDQIKLQLEELRSMGDS